MIAVLSMGIVSCNGCKNEKNEKNEEEAEEKTCIGFYMGNINPLITQHEVDILNDYNKDLSITLAIVRVQLKAVISYSVQGVTPSV